MFQVPAKPKQGSSVEEWNDDDIMEVEEPGPSRRENTRRRAPVKYDFDDEGESSGSDIVPRRTGGKKIQSDSDFDPDNN